MTRLTIVWPLGLVLHVASGTAVLGQDSIDEAARLEFFESRIRPVLVEHCYPCHNSASRAEGGLVLDHREGARTATSSGTAVVPGKPEQSLLLQVIRHDIEFLEMPEGGPRLSDDVIADFERWVNDGAVDPRNTPPSGDELAAATSWEATLARRKEWWSLQPIRSTSPPPASEWSDHPIDRFIERELERKGLARAPSAGRRTLIRRLSYALIGLPPTPAEIDAYLADERPGAFERVVDRLLASGHYGERWARHWMDVVRYADSHGSEGDPSIPHAYRYRDYLIRAFNSDVPYDQLVREHVAGDMLPEPRIDDILGIDESAIGTAHWRLVFHGFAPTDALDEKVRFVDDEINVFGKAFLAQTISCARCHDHKFDAISQADYYALFGVLGSCRPGMLDVNTVERQTLHREELDALKSQIREGMAVAWLRACESLHADSQSADVSLVNAQRPDHPLHPVHEVDRRVREGTTFDIAWRSMCADSVEQASDDVKRRWDLTTADGMREWFASGNGLTGSTSPAGGFAIDPVGPHVLSGIYPAGVYTHLLSTRQRGVLQSARYQLDGEHEVWGRAIGSGAKWRYVVQDYPRQGTVYPIVGLDNQSWAWHRLDLSYWDSDSIHLELFTNKDAPIEVGGADRSWFGVREFVLQPKGTGKPAEPRDPFGLAADISRGTPRSRGDLLDCIGASVRAALEAWRRSDATDEQALLLDACLRHGLLANSLDGLPNIAALVARYRELEARVPLPTRVPGLLEADASDQPLFVRGDHRQPAQVIPRRFLEAIDDEPYGSATSGRLELAEDLLREDNPLTARVITNRIWHHLFGRGLVATPDNFGRLGGKPSHPELLDYLATRMVDREWSIKDMIRFLVTSKTWQLASGPPAGARAQDPENVWLSHAPLRRLDAEAIRDSLFAATGRLDERMYGPGFAANSRDARRSVYVLSRRNGLDAFLGTFDAPVPFAPVGARAATNVPAQSLAMLNDELVWDLAARWGSEMRSSPAYDSEDACIAHMFEVVTGRPPVAAETRALLEYGDSVRAAARDEQVRRAELDGQGTLAQSQLAAILDPARETLLAEAGIRVPGPGLEPIARWDFRVGVEDTVGVLDGVLHGGARMGDGGLLLADGGYMSTPAIDRDLNEKTLEVWVKLNGLDQRGGGVMTVQDLDGGVFDSIVYGERMRRRWIAGSNNFSRTEDFGGVDEASALSEPVHVAIAYDKDGRIRAYRNGALYGEPYRKARVTTFRAGDSQVLFGLRHGAASPGRLLAGVISQARLYDRALAAEEIAASASGGAFVSRAEVLAALTDERRDEVTKLEAQITAVTRELDAMGEPAGVDEAWTRIAHALFNLKEFLYVR